MKYIQMSARHLKINDNGASDKYSLLYHFAQIYLFIFSELIESQHFNEKKKEKKKVMDVHQIDLRILFNEIFDIYFSKELIIFEEMRDTVFSSRLFKM